MGSLLPDTASELHRNKTHRDWIQIRPKSQVVIPGFWLFRLKLPVQRFLNLRELSNIQTRAIKGGIAQKHGVTNPQLCKSGKLHAGQNQEQTVISPAAAWASVAKKCCHGWSAKILYHQMLYRVSVVINALFYHGLDIFHTYNIYYMGL